MGKKKKKNSNKISNNNTPSGFQKNSNCEENCLVEKGRKREGVVLKIHFDGTHGRTTIKGENERIVYIHESDATSLSVSNNDFVIATEVKAEQEVELEDDEDISQTIVWNKSDDDTDNKSPRQPKFISVCKIKVVRSSLSKSNNNSKTSFSSPKSPKNNKNDRHVNKGEAKLYPPILSQRIFQTNGKKSQTSVSVSSPSLPSNNLPMTPSPTTTTTKATTTTPQSNSSKTSNFSFKSFVASPPRPTSSKKGDTKRSKFTSTIILLPLKHHDHLARYLLQRCNTLHLRLVTTTTTNQINNDHPMYTAISTLKRSKKLLERMVLAVCCDNYFRHDDIITISFQGRKVRFEVLATNSSLDEKIEQLNESMASISLTNCEKKSDKSGGGGYNDNDKQEDDNADSHDKKNNLLDGNLSDSISQSIVSQILYKSEKHVLHYISTNTKIIFHFDINDSIGNDMDVRSAPTINEISPCHVNNKVVAGLDSVIQQIHTFLKPTLLHPELFPKTGPIRAPKGILLHGSSGCGKSLLAHQIEIDVQSGVYLEGLEITNDDHHHNDHNDGHKKLNIDIKHINCASIQATTSIIGEAERTLTKLFEKAEYRTREGISTLLVLDDIHLICPRRGAAGAGGGSDRVASTLLALMDGIGQNQNNDRSRGFANTFRVGNVAVLAITSNPAFLDPALRRAGRLDNEIEVPNPDDKARAQIFELILNEVKRDKICLPQLNSILFMKYAKLAKGFTGGDCALCLKEAVRQSITRSNENEKCDDLSITDADIIQAIKNTKPSAIKSITVEIPSVPWSSIGGMDDVKNLLREAIELPMTHAHLFEALHIPPPRGVLLYGPPGCSKTLMARALATEGNMNFLTVKGPELLSKWLGESERQLASLFRRARLASPCVIFFDEIDAIASKRGSSGSSGGERMLSQLLTELDGINMTGGISKRSDALKSQPRVVVVGATNRPDLLDNALTRPGRIDRMIYVGLPDQASREAIFELQFRGRSCDRNLNIKQLAAESHGFSGAEIVSICREAALYAIEEIDKKCPDEEPMIKMHHVMHSLQNTKQQITPKMLQFYSSYGSGK